MSAEENPSIWLKAFLPAVVLLVAIGVLVLVVASKSEPPREEPRAIMPKVETVTVHETPVTLRVTSQGTVSPRTRTQLTARVSGLITQVSKSFKDGGFFREGDLLLTLDPVPYEAALAEAQAALAGARLALAREEALSEQARIDWNDLGTSDTPPPLVLREPQLEKARADVAAAEAVVRRTRQNLEFTEIRAPYDGRVQRKNVDVGQSVTAQATVLADIYATDVAEIRLPIELDELARLRIPEAYEGSVPETPAVPVTLRAAVGGEQHEWEGVIDRTEGAVDPDSRMAYVVARVSDPYAPPSGGYRPPLKVGMYVEAVIEGRELESAIRVPRGALQPDNSVYRISDDNRLEKVFPEIAGTGSDSVIVTSGLEDGDRLSLTPLLFFVDGMRVDPVGDSASDETPSADASQAEATDDAEDAQ